MNGFDECTEVVEPHVEHRFYEVTRKDGVLPLTVEAPFAVGVEAHWTQPEVCEDCPDKLHRIVVVRILDEIGRPSLNHP